MDREYPAWSMEEEREGVCPAAHVEAEGSASAASERESSQPAQQQKQHTRPAGAPEIPLPEMSAGLEADDSTPPADSESDLLETEENTPILEVAEVAEVAETAETTAAYGNDDDAGDGAPDDALLEASAGRSTPLVQKGEEAHASGACRPCVFALKGTCRFSEEECQYCHAAGHVKFMRPSKRRRDRRKQLFSSVASSSTEAVTVAGSTMDLVNNLVGDLPAAITTAAAAATEWLDPTGAGRLAADFWFQAWDSGYGAVGADVPFEAASLGATDADGLFRPRCFASRAYSLFPDANRQDYGFHESGACESGPCASGPCAPPPDLVPATCL